MSRPLLHRAYGVRTWYDGHPDILDYQALEAEIDRAVDNSVYDDNLHLIGKTSVPHCDGPSYHFHVIKMGHIQVQFIYKDGALAETQTDWIS